MLLRAHFRFLISRIHMAEDTHHWIIRQHALDALIRFGGAIAVDDLACVLGVADADADAGGGS